MSIRHVVEGTLILLVLSSTLVLTACNAGLKHVSGIDGLVLEFHSNRSQARVGEPIQMQFTITNRGRDNIVIESPDTPVMDIVVGSYGSDEVFLTWSTLNPDKVTQILKWQPSESKTIELIWTPKQGEIWYGAPRNVGGLGLVYRDSKVIQSARVIICASNVCQ